jgi:hypothetical protein
LKRIDSILPLFIQKFCITDCRKSYAIYRAWQDTKNEQARERRENQKVTEPPKEKKPTMNRQNQTASSSKPQTVAANKPEPKVFQTIDDNSLMAQEYERVFVFVGSPKVGKSWLPLNLPSHSYRWQAMGFYHHARRSFDGVKWLIGLKGLQFLRSAGTLQQARSGLKSSSF